MRKRRSVPLHSLRLAQLLNEFPMVRRVAEPSCTVLVRHHVNDDPSALASVAHTHVTSYDYMTFPPRHKLYDYDAAAVPLPGRLYVRGSYMELARLA